MKLADIMTKRVVTVTESKSLRAAARLMNKAEIGSIVVTRAGKVVGIVTERDLLKAVARGTNVERTRVKDLMTQPVVVGNEKNELEDAIKIMVLNRIKKLPVLRGSRLVGIVTFSDFARVEPLIHDLLVKAIQDADQRQRRMAEAKFKKYIADREPPAELYA